MKTTIVLLFIYWGLHRGIETLMFNTIEQCQAVREHLEKKEKEGWASIWSISPCEIVDGA